MELRLLREEIDRGLIQAALHAAGERHLQQQLDAVNIDLAQARVNHEQQQRNRESAASLHQQQHRARTTAGGAVPSRQQHQARGGRRSSGTAAADRYYEAALRSRLYAEPTLYGTDYYTAPGSVYSYTYLP
jgi:hypothetical protein